jgi:hypothetical protein
MDIAAHLQPIVDSMVNELRAQINQELRQQLSAEIMRTVAATELTQLIELAVSKQVEARLQAYDFHATEQIQLNTLMAGVVDNLQKSLVNEATSRIHHWVNQQLTQVNVMESVNTVVSAAVAQHITGSGLGTGSIPHTAIDFQGFQITGDSIRGGIIQQFGSTGIEDRASHVQITLMDHAVAMENTLYVPDVLVQGNIIVNGNVSVRGGWHAEHAAFAELVTAVTTQAAEHMTPQLFAEFSQTVFANIQQQGLDLNRITLNGREVLSGNQLGYHVVDSNLQRVGVLTDLQTTGENLLCDTLYVNQQRVGINTMDPTAVLSVWDQEVEIVVNKHSQDTAYVGTARHQRLVVGANNQQNICCMPDGTVQVKHIDIGAVAMSSSNQLPTWPSRAGHVVWNEAPAPGDYVGWVCLGGPRWAGFARIDS